MAEKGFLTIPEASQKTGIPKSTLYDAIRRKSLKSHIVCDKNYVAETDLKSYIGEASAIVWEMTQPKRGSK